MSELGELDRRVAEKVMGWHQETDWRYGDWLDCDGNIFETTEHWRPSISIKHAWQVVERMIELGWTQVFVQTHLQDGEHGWFVEILRWQLPPGDETEGGRQFAEALPEAICRAALEAVEA